MVRRHMIVQLGPGDEVEVRRDGDEWLVQQFTNGTPEGDEASCDYVFVVPRSVDIDQAWADRPTGTRVTGGATARIVGRSDGHLLLNIPPGVDGLILDGEVGFGVEDER